jgi:hypothetical protein
MPESEPDLPFRHALTPQVAERVHATTPPPHAPPAGGRPPEPLRRRRRPAAIHEGGARPEVPFPEVRLHEDR